MPAPGTSNVVNLPSGEREKPCVSQLVSWKNPTTVPFAMIAVGKVPSPSPGSAPAPGASNVVILPSGARMKP